MNDYPELTVARGLRNGLLIAIPFWIVLLLAVTKCSAQELQTPLDSLVSHSTQRIKEAPSVPNGGDSGHSFSLALGSYIVASSVDTGYSLYLFHTKHAREAGLGRGMEQQPAKFVATKATVLTGTVLVLRVLEQKYPKLAKWTTYGFLGWESAILVHNYTVTR